MLDKDDSQNLARQVVFGIPTLLLTLYVLWKYPEKLDILAVKLMHVSMAAWAAYFVDLWLFNKADRLFKQIAPVMRVNAWQRRAYIFMGCCLCLTFGIV